MSGARVPFDPDLPFVVATQDGLPIGGRVVTRGQLFRWRDLGVSEFDLLQLYTYFKVDCVPWMTRGERPSRGEIRALRTDDGQTLVVTADEAVHVETLKQRRRRERAAQRTE